MHIFRQSNKFRFAYLLALERILEIIVLPYLSECAKQQMFCMPFTKC